jgi:hypothetical protein
MMNTKPRCKKNYGTITIGVVTFLISGSGFSQEGDIQPVTSSPISPATTAAYWTPERLKSARPPNIAIEGSPERSMTQVPGLMIEEPGGRASSLYDEEDSVLLEEDAKGTIDITGAMTDDIDPAALYSYPPPYTTYAVPETWYGSFPHRAVGKLYYTLNGSNWVCSASVINTTSNSVIATAGHCLADGYGNWGDNWAFKPAHRPSWDAPYGTWYPYEAVSNTGWTSNRNWCYDYGFLLVSGNIEGVVGGLGYSYNAPRFQHWHQFGYPSAWGWSGHAQIATASSWNENLSCSGGPALMGTGWGQAPGSSGGPWVRVYKPQQVGANNYLNGVTSNYYSAYPEVIYSPYFDTTWYNILMYANDRAL